MDGRRKNHDEITIYKYDVINGDEYDKAILAQQIQEAIQTIVSLRIALANAKHEGSPMILNNVKG